MCSLSLVSSKVSFHLCFVFLVCATWVLCGVYGDDDESYHHRKYSRKGEVFDRSSIGVEVEDNGASNNAAKLMNFMIFKASSSYVHAFLETEFGWRIIVGSVIGFCGAALGSAGGIGAGGIFIPMLALVIGFDAKSSTAISKCMIMGLSGATVVCNLKQRHPTISKPLIDYDLAVLVQPMLLLGISTGVTLNVVFANWMVTILLLFVFLSTSSRSIFKGVEMWNKETEKKRKAAELLESGQTLHTPLFGSLVELPRVALVENVKWKQLSMLIFVWLTFLAIQIFKEFTTTCSTIYWVLYFLQIPVAFGATIYQAFRQNRKNREQIHHNAEDEEDVVGHISVRQFLLRSFVALLAGMIGGLLGLGGGFLLSPLFLEIGVIPQVSSATATFVMTFSASMCAIEYYLLNRFPMLYAIYFTSIAIVASLVGQYVVKSWIARAGRPSLIVFILSSIILVSAILLGGTGILDIIDKINHNEYMGFEDLCTSALTHAPFLSYFA